MRKILFLIVLVAIRETSCVFRCDRRPYGATTQAAAADGRFELQVLGTEDTYLPEQLYTVQLTRTDDESLFIGFMISAEGDTQPDPQNPRRMVTMDAGEITRIGTTSKYRARCSNTLEQTNSAPKESVEVYWRAPESGSGCVSLRAMVAENDELWYEDGAPLSKRICEDLSQPDDMSPVLNTECNICDEAKYEVSFTGIWSRNTHPVLYPETDWLPKFSDLVGVSHSVDYTLWAPGNLASDGLKDLAEYANSSKLEGEIMEQIGQGVRTLIKGKGHGYLKMQVPSYSFFRADKVNHLVSVAVALYPSPDWFLGISRFELCTADNTWLDERELNLYPWDAGTDSGVSYESPNIPTYPQDSIDRVQMRSPDKNSPFYDIDMTDLHPFGTLHLKLVRTYQKTCEEPTDDGETDAPDEGEKKDSEEIGSEPDEPSRYQNEHTGNHGGELPPERDPDTPEECPMTQWTEWSPCEGDCQDGWVQGYKWRERFHMIGDVVAEKYDPDNPDDNDTAGVVPEYCKMNFEEFDRQSCNEKCDDEEEKVTVDRRIMDKVSPGHGWNSRKRGI